MVMIFTYTFQTLECNLLYITPSEDQDSHYYSTFVYIMPLLVSAWILNKSQECSEHRKSNITCIAHFAIGTAMVEIYNNE